MISSSTSLTYHNLNVLFQQGAKTPRYHFSPADGGHEAPFNVLVFLHKWVTVIPS